MRKAVEELKRQNINKIIAIGHSGIDIDQKVAKEVDGVDIVVGGHEHALLYTGKRLSLPMLYLYPQVYGNPAPAPTLRIREGKEILEGEKEEAGRESPIFASLISLSPMKRLISRLKKHSRCLSPT